VTPAPSRAPRAGAHRSSILWRGWLVAALWAAVGACNGKVVFDPAGCDRDDECQLSTLHCDTATASCVECLTDAHCAAAATGSPSTSAPMSALGASTVCDPTLHRCVECHTDADCGAGHLCREDRCVVTCQKEGPDPLCKGATSHCEGDLGFCIECEDDNRACAAISAVGTICDRKIGRCVACLSDANCGGTNPRCDTTEGRCVVCLTSDDCGPKLPLCDPAALDCIAPP